MLNFEPGTLLVFDDTECYFFKATTDDDNNLIVKYDKPHVRIKHGDVVLVLTNLNTNQDLCLCVETNQSFKNDVKSLFRKLQENNEETIL